MSDVIQPSASDRATALTLAALIVCGDKDLIHAVRVRVEAANAKATEEEKAIAVAAVIGRMAQQMLDPTV